MAAPAVTPVVSIPRMISSDESVATGLLEGLALLERRLSGRGHLGDRRHLLDRLLDLLHPAQQKLLELVRLGVPLLVAVDVGERRGDQRSRPVRAGEDGTVLGLEGLPLRELGGGDRVEELADGAAQS